MADRRRRLKPVTYVCAVTLVAAVAGVMAFELPAGQSIAAGTPTPTTGYSVFSAPTGDAEAMPAGLAAEQPPDAELRAQPTTTTGVLAWAVAGDGQICVAESDAGGGSEACASAATVTANTNSLLYTATAEGTPSNDTGAVDLVAGLAPDGVSDVTLHFGNGTSAQVPVVDNGFQLKTATPVTIASLSWEDSAGVPHTQEIGGP